MYFDETLGYPIFWNGSGYVTGAGAAVAAYSAPADPTSGVEIDNSFDDPAAFTVAGKCLNTMAGQITLQATVDDSAVDYAEIANTGMTAANGEHTITLLAKVPFTGTVVFTYNGTDDPVEIVFDNEVSASATFTPTATSTVEHYAPKEANNPVTLIGVGITHA